LVSATGMVLAGWRLPTPLAASTHPFHVQEATRDAPSAPHAHRLRAAVAASAAAVHAAEAAADSVADKSWCEWTPMVYNVIKEIGA